MHYRGTVVSSVVGLTRVTRALLVLRLEVGENVVPVDSDEGVSVWPLLRVTNTKCVEDLVHDQSQRAFAILERRRTRNHSDRAEISRLHTKSVHIGALKASALPVGVKRLARLPYDFILKSGVNVALVTSTGGGGFSHHQ